MQSEPSSQADALPCQCGDRQSEHRPYTEGGCTQCGCETFRLGAKRPTVINNRCKCSHDRFRHQHPTKTDGSCWEPDCDCMQYVPVTVETVELPEPCTCAAAGDAFAPSGHYADCPEAPPEPDGYWKHPEGKTHEECPTCWGVSEAECMCCTPALADEPWAPPQPERRPPLTVQYSVAGGHPYEVSIPGDASVTAEDGVLIIKHPSTEILAITRVAPMEG